MPDGGPNKKGEFTLKKSQKKKIQKQNRWLALVLCLSLLVSVFTLDLMAYAADTDCDHQHDSSCGYVETVESQPCTFTYEHDETCGYTESVEDRPCSVESAHIHDTDVCGYAEAVEDQPCTHVHDNNCDGLAQNSTPQVPCSLNEGCILPTGHEGDCELPMTLSDSPGVLASASTGYAPGGNVYNVDKLVTALGSNNVTVNDTTVTLNTDVNLDKYIIVYGTSLTLNLNGHTLGASSTLDAGSYNSMLIVNNGTLIIKNGTIRNSAETNKTALKMYGAGNIQLENVGLVEGNVMSDKDSTLQINTSIAVNGKLMVNGVIRIANGATLDLRNGSIAINDNRKFVIFKAADVEWNTTTPLVLANDKTSKWFVELDTAASGLPEGYNLAYAQSSGLSEWKLQAPGYKVSYRLAGHVHTDFTQDSVAPGNTLTMTLTADSGYRIVRGNVKVFSMTNGARVPRTYEYNEETGVLTVDNVSTDLFIDVLENIIVTLDNVENGRIEVKDTVGTITHNSDFLAVYLEKLVIQCIPDPGYQLTQLTVNGNSFESGSVYTVMEPTVIAAVFEPTPEPPAIPPTITTTSLEGGMETAAYQDMLGAGGSAPIAWSVVAGRLPDGLMLTTDGRITGTPSAPGAFQFTVRAENSAGFDERAFTIEIRAKPEGTDYRYKTLTDPATGINVTGVFSNDAVLSIEDSQVLHEIGTCPACDNIRARQEAGELVVLYDIRLFAGSYKGDVEVSIPIGEAFNNQTIDFLHCNKNALESRTLTVSGGIAKGMFSSLSPFAVANVPIVIANLPATYSMDIGESISWTPTPAGGSWSYDKNYLEMTLNGGTCTFRALKEGKTTAAYTVNKVTHTVTITINSGHAHNYEGDWQYDGNDHWQLCSCGEAGAKTPHSGGTANCHKKAVCAVCGASYKELDPNNHDGGTEQRNVKAASRNAEGYTGDTYCLGCGELLARGKAVPRTVTPQTGDPTSLWPWFALMLTGLTCSIGILAAKKRRRKNHKKPM